MMPIREDIQAWMQNAIENHHLLEQDIPQLNELINELFPVGEGNVLPLFCFRAARFLVEIERRVVAQINDRLQHGIELRVETNFVTNIHPQHLPQPLRDIQNLQAALSSLHGRFLSAGYITQMREDLGNLIAIPEELNTDRVFLYRINKIYERIHQGRMPEAIFTHMRNSILLEFLKIKFYRDDNGDDNIAFTNSAQWRLLERLYHTFCPLVGRRMNVFLNIDWTDRRHGLSVSSFGSGTQITSWSKRNTGFFQLPEETQLHYVAVNNFLTENHLTPISQKDYTRLMNLSAQRAAESALTWQALVVVPGAHGPAAPGTLGDLAFHNFIPQFSTLLAQPEHFAQHFFSGFIIPNGDGRYISFLPKGLILFHELLHVLHNAEGKDIRLPIEDLESLTPETWGTLKEFTAFILDSTASEVKICQERGLTPRLFYGSPMVYLFELFAAAEGRRAMIQSLKPQDAYFRYVLDLERVNALAPAHGYFHFGAH